MSLQERTVREIPHLRRFARSLTGNAVDADDLVQSVLERALGRLHLLRKPSSLRAWLFRMTYNLHVNDRIRYRRAPVATDPQDATLEVASPSAQDTRLDVMSVLKAMQLLPEDQRAAIALTALEDLSYKEAAVVLDIPVGTLMSRLHRGRMRLKELTEVTATSAVRPAHLRRVK